jgi:hypothetical protein
VDGLLERIKAWSWGMWKLVRPYWFKLPSTAENVNENFVLSAKRNTACLRTTIYPWYSESATLYE